MPRALYPAILIGLFNVAMPVSAQTQSLAELGDQVRQSAAIVQLITAFTKAQHDFDQPRIRALTDDDYVEISPVGDVDPRDRMIRFYAADKKVAAPDMTIGETTVTMADAGAALAVTTISYHIVTPGQPERTSMLRAAFVAKRDRGTWKLLSAQYTPIHAKG